jgi:hypothetical protein
VLLLLLEPICVLPHFAAKVSEALVAAGGVLILQQIDKTKAAQVVDLAAVW